MKNWKVRYRSLMIEVTRMCNLRCEHCMRGEPQDLNITREILKKTFQQIDFVETLHLTGGEPFLYPELIEMLVDVMIETNLQVNRLSTVDNGTVIGADGRRCIEALNRAGRYICDTVWTDELRAKAEERGQKPISISISNSKYHVNDIEAAIAFYQSCAEADLLEMIVAWNWDTIPKQYMDLYEQNKTKLHNPKIPEKNAFELELVNNCIDAYCFLKRGLHELYPLFTAKELEKFCRLICMNSILEAFPNSATQEEKEWLVNSFCCEDGVSLDNLIDTFYEMHNDHIRRENKEYDFWDRLGLRAYRNQEILKKKEQAKLYTDSIKADQR